MYFISTQQTKGIWETINIHCITKGIKQFNLFSIKKMLELWFKVMYNVKKIYNK